MEHAYGLYSHIRSNRIRSIFLLIGLFLLVYILVYAGALVAEAFLYGGDQLALIMLRAKSDFFLALPFATIAAIVWILIAYFFTQTMLDAVTAATELTPN